MRVQVESEMAELDAADKALFLEELGVTDPDATGLNALVCPEPLTPPSGGHLSLPASRILLPRRAQIIRAARCHNRTR